MEKIQLLQRKMIIKRFEISQLNFLV